MLVIPISDSIIIFSKVQYICERLRSRRYKLHALQQDMAESWRDEPAPNRSPIVRRQARGAADESK